MISDNIISDEYVYTDTETTGLDHNLCEIVEVAAVKFNLNGDILGTFHEYCYPMSGVIPREASNIHGITIDKVAGKKPYMEIRADLAAFIGKRTLVGHNLVGFDIKFLKLEPVEMHDTLLMCRKIWPGKNNLGNACARLGIKFNKDEAHSAVYDVKKGVELYLTLINLNKEKQQTTIGQAPSISSTQVYSFSRINTFLSCPFKWKQIYLLKNKEPNRSYFTVGKVMHKIAQISALWCYMRTFGNKFSVYAEGKKWVAPKELTRLIEVEVQNKGVYLPTSMDEVSLVHIGMFLYKNPGYIQTFLGRTIIEIVEDINAVVKEGEYEIVGMPDAETYSKIVQISMVTERCIDKDCIKDVMWMSEFFYKQRDFSLSPNEVAIVEKQLIFDKDWVPLKNWYDEKGFIRGVLDVVEYNGSNQITIIDYKTSRTMLTEQELVNDLQLKIYVLYIHKYMPEIDTITIRHHYIRYGKVISATITNVKAAADEAETWVRESINEIEVELLKPDKEAFKPCRNEYCSSCFLMESNECPLFSIKNINNIEDPGNFVIKSIDDFKKAWKKIEVNSAQNKNLTAKCKAYMKNCQGRILIDDKAAVDFWVKEDVSYDPVETSKLLVAKGVKIASILDECSLPKTALEKIVKRAKLDLTDEEIVKISKKKSSMKFDAYTEKEIEEAGFLNK
jgi:DNA polymerase-3 subunit epsilon